MKLSIAVAALLGLAGANDQSYSGPMTPMMLRSQNINYQLNQRQQWREQQLQMQRNQINAQQQYR